MTDREKAIVMAYTGICMLTGDKFDIFHKYVEEIMGRPVWTHEFAFGFFADALKKKAEPDFIKLCEGSENDSKKSNKWIPVSEGDPAMGVDVLVCTSAGCVYTSFLDSRDEWCFSECGDVIIESVVAWMPLPEPYKPESEE